MIDPNDVHSLALVAWREAEGEGTYGCTAVMWVCRNRVGKPGFGKTLHDVIYGKNQFTSMSVPSDPRFSVNPADGDLMWQSCQSIAQRVLEGVLPDNTGGAIFYANLKNIQPGGWFERNIVDKYPVTKTINHHTFYGPLDNHEEVQSAATGEA